MNRRFESSLRDTSRQHKNAIHLVTKNEQLDVYLYLKEGDHFHAEVDQSLELTDFEEVYIRYSKDSKVFINIEGLDLSASFGYKKENVMIDEIEAMLAEIDDAYQSFSIKAY